MKPIGKYIVIKTIEEEIKTSSGLLLSAEDANQMRYKKGKVVKPGSTVEVIKENDEIYYDKRAGFTMLIENEPYTIISENDVVVVL
jgi:co-chaperonin GroES (HSP10)|uniref:Co-chaperonin GroES n=1 Tax=uncultured virus TaxID=340016 RepID=A0A221S3P6_9VIRU|nr:co-chaperonin GroES [uncultured virus]